MKKIVAMVLGCLLVCTMGAAALDVDIKSTFSGIFALDEPYAFPYEPGTQEWDDLGSYTNRLAASQIPQDILLQLNTTALLQTILEYPFLGDITAFNTYNETFDMMKFKFNAVDELLRREDCYDAAYEIYQSQSMNINEHNALDLTQITFIEVLLSRDELLSTLSETQKEQLEALKTAKYEQKLQYPEIYGVTLYTPYMLDGFLPVDDETAPYVTTPTHGRYSIKWIYTGCGTKVEAWVVQESLTTAEYNNELNRARSYSSATILANPTLRYNCHSYAFWDTSTSNEYWINNPINFLACYNSISSPSVNAKIYYNASSHSGIVESTGSKIRVKAKWGAGCLVVSDYDDNPYYVGTNDITYFTS